MQTKKKTNASKLQTAVIVSVDQLLKVVNKGHLKIVLTNSIVTMINTINNCNKQVA